MEVPHNTKTGEEGFACGYGTPAIDVYGAEEGLDDVGKELRGVEAGEEGPGIASSALHSITNIRSDRTIASKAGLLGIPNVGGGMAHEFPDVRKGCCLNGGEVPKVV